MRIGTSFAAIICWVITGCHSNRVSNKLQPDYKRQGDSIAAASFNHIRTALQNSMAENGPAQSILFCKAKAMELTGKLSSDSVSIMRVAERFRNPVNHLQPADKSIWNQYKQAISKGDSVFPTIIVSDSVVEYYKPIILQPMCITCHGDSRKDIPGQVLHVIDSVYPGDLAKGFSPGDLRGMWHIRFFRDQ
jgi:hypothetical protein